MPTVHVRAQILCEDKQTFLSAAENAIPTTLYVRFFP